MKEFPAVSEMRGMLFIILTVGVIFRVIFPMIPVSEVNFFPWVHFFSGYGSGKF